jgi:nucleoside-diphosphate-sugar epimerase
MIDLSQLDGKTVLITGSTGLIGGELVRSISHTKARICTPSHEELSFPFGSFPYADIIVHAAGYGQPSVFMRKPIETIQVNTDLTIRLLRHLRPDGSFLFCSSSEIYNGLDKLATEYDIGTTAPSHPRSCYIESKRCGEAIVNAFRKAGVKAASARIAPTYGPGTRLHDTKAMSQFIEQALTKNKIELQDSGKAVRTYGYITDVVEMLWNIVLYGTQPVYNVGGKSVTTIANLARQIGQLTGAEAVIPEDKEDQIGGAKVVRLDLTRYESEFGKTDYVSLHEGLLKTIKYQRGLYNG